MIDLENLKVVPYGITSNHHPKCKSYRCNSFDEPNEYDCGYNTFIGCDECRYGGVEKTLMQNETKTNDIMNMNTFVLIILIIFAILCLMLSWWIVKKGSNETDDMEDKVIACAMIWPYVTMFLIGIATLVSALTNLTLEDLYYLIF